MSKIVNASVKERGPHYTSSRSGRCSRSPGLVVPFKSSCIVAVLAGLYMSFMETSPPHEMVMRASKAFARPAGHLPRYTPRDRLKSTPLSTCATLDHPPASPCVSTLAARCSCNAFRPSSLRRSRSTVDPAATLVVAARLTTKRLVRGAYRGAGESVA